MKLHFREWFSKTAEQMFGFDAELSFNKTIKRQPDEHEEPLKPLKADILMDELVRLGPINKLKPRRTFLDHIEYGDQPGAIAVEISPLGSLRMTVRKLTTDSVGTQTWTCKKVFPLISQYHEISGERETRIANEVYDQISKLDDGKLDAPKNVYPEFEKLVLYLGDRVRRDHPQWFIYDGIKKLDHHNYMIVFNVRGQGVGRLQGDKPARVEEFNINLQHNPNRGIIRCWGYDVISPMTQHTWKPQPSEWDEIFMPSQSQVEIGEAVVAALSTY
jgi:hypothetical protein